MVVTRTSKPVLLRDVELTPRRRIAARVHALLLIVFAVIAGVTEFLPAHEVLESDDSAWDGLACAFLTDCDPSMFDSGEPTPVESRKVVAVHSSYDHDGIAVVLLLAALVLLALANLRWPRWRLALGSALGSLAWLVALFGAVFNLDHLFDATRPLPGGELNVGALGALCLAVLAWIPLVLILYLGARRARRREALADEPDLPTATAL